VRGFPEIESKKIHHYQFEKWGGGEFEVTINVG
jgi:hypothetical protein